MPTGTVQANEEKLRRAVALHRSGHLAQAVSLYEEILQSQPTHLHATFFLGVSYAQQNNVRLSRRVFW